jgi:putative peptidoglycan lipid II flippase
MNLLKAASTVSILTLASRITGLVRDQLIAAAFGAGAATDAFNVAFRIPNLLRRLFGEGAFSQAFVPILGATREREGEAATHALIDAVATVLTWALLATCLIGVAFAPVVVWVIGAELEAFDDAVLMTRWMFPYIGFIALVALSAGVLNTWRRFAVPAATPVLLNLSIIVAAWWGAPWLQARGVPPIYALAGGVMLGGLLQLAVQLPALRAIGCLPHIGLSLGRSSPPGATRACSGCCGRWRRRCSAYRWRSCRCSSIRASPPRSASVRFRGSALPTA